MAVLEADFSSQKDGNEAVFVHTTGDTGVSTQRVIRDIPIVVTAWALFRMLIFFGNRFSIIAM